MLQHMRSSHSSFLASTEQKVDKTLEDSLQEKARCQLPISASICSYCNLDCGSRRKLKQHIESNHIEGVDQEIDPDLKNIRLQNNSYDDEPKKPKKSTAITQEKTGKAAKTSDTDKQKTKGADTDKVKTGKSSERIKAAKDNKQQSKVDGDGDKPASTSAKAEKRYKCFWCSTSFRKRGKLMDHIDMFHRDSRDQSEMEAEMLYTNEFSEQSAAECAETSTAGVSNTTPKTDEKSDEQIAEPVTDTTETIAEDITPSELICVEEMPEELPEEMSPDRPSSILSCTFPQDFRECNETPFNNICEFVLCGTITEVSKRQVCVTKNDQSLSACNRFTSVLPTCFFFRKKEDDPLPIAMVLPKAAAADTAPAKPTPSYGRSISFPVSDQLRAPQYSTQISNNDAQQMRLSAFKVPSIYPQDGFSNVNHLNQSVTSLRISQQPMYPLLGGPMHLLSPTMQYMYPSPRMPIPLSATPLSNSLLVSERSNGLVDSHFGQSFTYAGRNDNVRYEPIDSDAPLDLSCRPWLSFLLSYYLLFYYAIFLLASLCFILHSEDVQYCAIILV